MDDLHVSNWKVFCYKFIKKPFFSSLWYSALVYTIWNPSETLPTVLGILFLILSFTPIRFYLAILSPIPMIATVVLAFGVFNNTLLLIILIAAALWTIIYIVAMIVWRKIFTGEYVLSPVSNVLIKNPQNYLMPKK